MAIPTFISPSGLSGTEELVAYLTELVNELQYILSSLDEKNIHHLDYIPMRADGSLGNATPKNGWIRTITVNSTTVLQYYNGASSWMNVQATT